MSEEMRPIKGVTPKGLVFYANNRIRMVHRGWDTALSDALLGAMVTTRSGEVLEQRQPNLSRLIDEFAPDLKEPIPDSPAELQMRWKRFLRGVGEELAALREENERLREERTELQDALGNARMEIVALKAEREAKK